MASVSLLVAAEDWLESLTTKLTVDQLGWPTPCDQWDVRGLLGHTLRTIEVFAAAVDGRPGPNEEEVFAGPDMIGDDPAGVTRAVTRRSQAAWSARVDFDQEVTTAFGAMPATFAISVSTFSTLVHGWDLAKTIGAGTEMPAELLDLGEAVAAQVVPPLRALGRFAPEVATRPGAGRTEQFIASTGRAPV